MEIIVHRVNTVAELQDTPVEYGVEVDLRDSGKRLILNHDPFDDGVDFEQYLEHYQHGILILNIKSERIEYRVLELLKDRGVDKYFFLDSSFPMIHLLTQSVEPRIALRFSEYEGLDTILAMRGRVQWVWVDCFTRLPVNPENYKILKASGFKLCLVSPELLGREGDVERYRRYLEAEAIHFDAVCTKSYNARNWS